MRLPGMGSDLWRPIRRQLVALVGRQRTNFQQSMAALLVCSVTALAAGLTLGYMTGTLERLPGLIVLVPAAIGMRGNIFGALGSRLGTAIHTGQFDGRLQRRNLAGQNVAASAALTLFISLALAVLAKEVARLFGVETIPLSHYITVSVIGGLISSIVILMITLAVAKHSVSRGWDMDNVAAPVVTAAGDLVTLPSLWLTTVFLPVQPVPQVVTALTLAATAWTTIYLLRAKRMAIFQTIVRQGLGILVVAALIDVIAGLTIDQRLERFVAFPGLLVLFPAFLADAGALGAILSARLASKLHLGSITPRKIPGLKSVEDIALTYVLGIPVFLMIGVSGTVVSSIVGFATPSLGRMVALTLLAGFIATTGAIFVAYYSAVASYHFGLDPDSYGIPAVTSSMDLLGTVALIVSMLVLGIAQ